MKVKKEWNKLKKSRISTAIKTYYRGVILAHPILYGSPGRKNLRIVVPHRSVYNIFIFLEVIDVKFSMKPFWNVNR